MAHTDPMTSLMNYTALCKVIDKFLRSKMPFSLSIIDIDDFGKFNKISYRFGDDVLKEFADFLKQSLTDDVLIARFRIGDEFVLLFKNADLSQTGSIIDALKEKLLNHHFNALKNASVSAVSFSEGAVEAHPEIDTIELLLSQAESNLKTNKLKLHHKISE